MFVNTRQAHVILKCLGTCNALQPIRRRGSVWGGTASAFRPGKIDRDPEMMRGDCVSRKETELGRTETSEECRYPWHADNLEKDSTRSQLLERIHVSIRILFEM